MRTLDQVPLSAKDRAAVEAAARLLKERFPVEEVILYGSKARGDDTPESDIDLLALTTRPMSWDEKGSMAGAAIDVAVDHDVLIELLIEAREAWLHGVYQALPIRHEVDRDGVVV
jgi:predicted nucleotidyltransferase